MVEKPMVLKSIELKKNNKFEFETQKKNSLFTTAKFKR